MDTCLPGESPVVNSLSGSFRKQLYEILFEQNPPEAIQACTTRKRARKECARRGNFLMIAKSACSITLRP
jgi:hypothetical protein